jgi:hypothetical protein
MAAEMGLLKFLKISLVRCLIPMTFLFLIACGLDDRVNLDDSAVTIKKMQPNQQIETTTHYGKSLRGEINSIPILVLRGNYEELGEAHGALAGKEIIHLLNDVFIPYVNQKQRDAWDKKLLPAARAYVFPARYERELAGLLAGIKKQYPVKRDRMLFSVNREISLDDLRALNCFNEFSYADLGCSSFSAWGPLTENGEVICARNLDERYIPGRIPFMVLARAPTEPGRQASIEIFAPGVIGVSTAMNADGLIVMAHHERGLHPSAPEPWQPRAIVLRDAIESSRATDSIDEVARSFEDRAVTLGNCTHIALPARGHPNRPLPFVLEWDGNRLQNGVTVRLEDPSMIANAILCTNHYVRRRPEKSEGSENSHKRYQALLGSLQRLDASKSTIDVEKAIRIMDSVARNGKTVTYLTVIAVPGERKMVFAVSPGLGVSATRGEWIEITWNQIFGAF